MYLDPASSPSSADYERIGPGGNHDFETENCDRSPYYSRTLFSADYEHVHPAGGSHSSETENSDRSPYYSVCGVPNLLSGGSGGGAGIMPSHQQGPRATGAVADIIASNNRRDTLLERGSTWSSDYEQPTHHSLQDKSRTDGGDSDRRDTVVERGSTWSSDYEQPAQRYLEWNEINKGAAATGKVRRSTVYEYGVESNSNWSSNYEQASTLMKPSWSSDYEQPAAGANAWKSASMAEPDVDESFGWSGEYEPPSEQNKQVLIELPNDTIA